MVVGSQEVGVRVPGGGGQSGGGCEGTRWWWAVRRWV